VLPQIVDRIGAAGALLLVVGGLAYTIGAVVYVRQRPDPVPHVFGYHEVFHALVIVAVACQYAFVAFFALPTA
jgi:hemolysin III